MIDKLILNTDGGSRNNPGPAGIGYVIKDSTGKILEKRGKYIGNYTNNEAEYKALIEGLRACAKLGGKTIDCFLDSQLVVNQLSGNDIRRQALDRFQGYF